MTGDHRPDREQSSLKRLIDLFVRLPPPEAFREMFPGYSERRENLIEALRQPQPEVLEERLLGLYETLHGYEVPMTPQEKRRFRALGGHLCHAGGLFPLLQAASFVHRQTVSGDFGAGNGVQGLLLQYLYPHYKTVQIEISSRLVAVGQSLQRWMGIDEERIEWVVGDIMDVSPQEMDFIYLYRPVKPMGPGKAFYQKLASELCLCSRPSIVFSVADCLGEFLNYAWEVFYTDGHLTCFRRRCR